MHPRGPGAARRARPRGRARWSWRPPERRSTRWSRRASRPWRSASSGPSSTRATSRPSGPWRGRSIPALYVALASDVAPVLGEYERTATAALSAYLGPPVLATWSGWRDALQRAAATTHELLLSHCMGGLTTVAEARHRPLLTLDSGPAGGVLGARYFGQLYGEPNVLCTDMGGTTFDVSLVRTAAPQLDESRCVDKYTCWCRRSTSTRSARAAAASSGSTRTACSASARRAPAPTRARPATARAARGRRSPTPTCCSATSTPTASSAGASRWTGPGARRRSTHVAEPLGMDRDGRGRGRVPHRERADGRPDPAQRPSSRATTRATSRCSPTAAPAPAHAAFYGRELGVKRLYVPSYSTVFSALGMLTGGRVHSAEPRIRRLLPLDEAERAGAEARFAALERGVLRPVRAEGVAAPSTCAAALRLREVPPPAARAGRRAGRAGRLTRRARAAALARDFEAAYARPVRRGRRLSSGGPRAGRSAASTAPAPTVTPPLVPREARRRAPTRSAARRSARGRPTSPRHGGFVATPIYDGAALELGNALPGPCIVERMGDTIVLPPGASGRGRSVRESVLLGAS